MIRHDQETVVRQAAPVMQEPVVTERDRRLEDDLSASTQAAIQRSEDLTVGMSDYARSERTQRIYIENAAFQYESRFDYVQRSALVDRSAEDGGLAYVPDHIRQAATPVVRDPDHASKDLKKAMAAEKAAQIHEARMAEMRKSRVRMDGTISLSFKDIKEEKQLLAEKLQAIELFLKDALADKSLTPAQVLDKKIMATADMAKAYHETAHLLPVDSPARTELLARKQEIDLKLRDLETEMKIELKMKDDAAEAKRDRDTMKRHARYDAIRAARTGALRPDESLSREDVAYRVQDAETGTDMTLINRGRALFGGTKPMYRYEQEGSGGEPGKIWLYKEAVNCTGGQTRERAPLTAVASKLQKIICGKDNFVPVFVAKDKQGRPIGTFQSQVETMKDPTVDLFSWQASPGKKIAEDPAVEKAITTQILREHTLDWVLGNFDTKGENFLQKADGNLVSIDKEASFSHLDNPAGDHMSMDVQLHKNNTIYNVMFREFVYRDPSMEPLDLDLNSVEKQVAILERMEEDEYLALFKEYLDEKFKPGSLGFGSRELEAERKAMEDKIIARKLGLRSEYASFFGHLIKERLRVLEGHPRMQQELREKYEGQLVDMPGGNMIFLLPSQAAAQAG